MPVVSQDAIRDCIRSFMQSKGLSNKDLAESMDLSTQTINNYLSKKDMSDKTIGKIAAALGYPTEMLLNGQRYYGTNTVDQLAERINALEQRVRELEERINR